jgi:hypothetical protein
VVIIELKSDSVHLSPGYDIVAPVFINWLHEHDPELQAFTITAILDLMFIGKIDPFHSISLSHRSQDELRSHMEGEIPFILSWLTLRNQRLRVGTLNVILSLVQYGIFSRGIFIIAVSLFLQINGTSKSNDIRCRSQDYLGISIRLFV